MGKKTKPKIELVDTRTGEQKAISKLLGDYLPGLLSDKPLTGEEIDLSLMGESWTKGVAGPMMRAFQTYIEPEISQSFRRGALFSQSRGNAIARALEGLQGSLTTELATRNWAATLEKTRMLERPYYEQSAGLKGALDFLQTPGLEAVGIQGQAGPDWLGAAATVGGAFVGGPAGAAMGASMFGSSAPGLPLVPGSYARNFPASSFTKPKLLF